MFGKNKQSFGQADAYEMYLGFGAALVRGRHSPPETMAMKDNQAEVARGLASEWGVTDRQGAVEIITWLLDEGHRAEFGDAYVKVKQGDLSAVPPEHVEVWESLQRVEKKWKMNLEDAANCRSLVGWDMERAAFLARCCLFLGYITEQEAWDYLILKICPVAKQAFTTWGQYGMSFLEGRVFCFGGGSGESAILVSKLWDDKKSLWNRYPLSSI